MVVIHNIRSNISQSPTMTYSYAFDMGGISQKSHFAKRCMYTITLYSSFLYISFYLFTASKEQKIQNLALGITCQSQSNEFVHTPQLALLFNMNIQLIYHFQALLQFLFLFLGLYRANEMLTISM